jgi:hypothetical protein
LIKDHSKMRVLRLISPRNHRDAPHNDPLHMGSTDFSSYAALEMQVSKILTSHGIELMASSAVFCCLYHGTA